MAQLIRHNINLIAILAVLSIISACHSAKRVAHGRNNFLLHFRIDTLKLEAREVYIKDSSIISCLDSIISSTKQLPEYDRRFIPIYKVYFKKNYDTIYVDFESNNIYMSLQNVPLLEEDYFVQPIYNVLINKGNRFIINVQFDSTKDLNTIESQFFKNTDHKIQIETYNFFSKKRNIYLYSHVTQLYKATWSNSIEYLYKNGELYYARRIYQPITEIKIKSENWKAGQSASVRW